MNQYRYEARIVPASVWDKVEIGGQYLGGEVADGISGMENDLVLIIAHPADSDTTSIVYYENPYLNLLKTKEE